jgi:hypothetical protein
VPSASYHCLTTQITTSAAETRTETMGGKDFLVVPAVAIVEGVLFASNAEHPALALASEFGRYPAGWNGRPVTNGHPKDLDGNAISANAVSLWDGGAVVGQMFNTTLDDKKLKTEMWLSKEKAGDEMIARFSANDQIVEVSTGLWSQDEDKQGKYNGRDYHVVWRNVVPDHLAILPEGAIGACSVEDGCGAPRTNSVKEYRMAELACNCGGTCDKCKAAPTQNQDKKGLKQSFSRFLRTLGLRDLKDRSDNDKRSALEAALEAEAEAADMICWCYVVAVYDGFFIYTSYGMDGDGGLTKRNYSIADNGVITLGAEREAVRPETEFVPVRITVEGGQSAAPAANSGDLTMNQQGQQAAGTATAPQANQTTTQPQTTPAQTPAPTQTPQTPQQAPGVTVPAVPTPGPTASAVADEAIAYYNNRKSQLISALAARGSYTAEELQPLPVPFLEKTLAALEAGVDRSAAAQQMAPPAQGQQQQPAANTTNQQPVSFMGAAPASSGVNAQPKPGEEGSIYTPMKANAFPSDGSVKPSSVHGVTQAQFRPGASR